MLGIGKVIIFALSFTSILFGSALYYQSHIAYPIDCSGIKDVVFKNDCQQVNNKLNDITIVSIGIGVTFISIAFGAILNEFLNPKQPMQNEVEQK